MIIVIFSIKKRLKKMLDITLEQIEYVLNEKGKKNGNRYNFQCPVCQDNHKDNLIFDTEKKILKCFSCFNNEGGKYVLNLINENFKKDFKPIEKKPKIEIIHQWEINKEKYAEYMLLTNDYLLNNDELLNYLKQKRGFNKKTIEKVGIGFDHTENCFTIPIFSLKYDCITDFELRLKSDKKQIRRVGGGCNTIAVIDYCLNEKVCYIVEGFMDGITLSQFLREHNKNDFIIFSCSNGVNSLINSLSEINFSLFKDVKLILDNDKAGDETTKKIIEKYPFIKDCRDFLIKENVKDINEWYMKGLKK